MDRSVPLVRLQLADQIGQLILQPENLESPAKYAKSEIHFCAIDPAPGPVPEPSPVPDPAPVPEGFSHV